MSNFKRMMMASAASGESQWVLQYIAGNDTYFMNVQPNSTYTEYGMQLTARPSGSGSDLVGIVKVTPDGVVTYEKVSTSTHPASANGVSHYKGAYGLGSTFWAGASTVNRALGAAGAVYVKYDYTGGTGYPTIVLETAKDDTSKMYFGERAYLRYYPTNGGSSLQMPQAGGYIRDIIASPSSGAVYALQVGTGQEGYVAKVVNTNLTFSANSKAVGYNTGSISYMFYSGRSASLAHKPGASSGYLYACGGDRILRFSTFGDSTTTTMSLNSFWRMNGSPQGIYSLGTLRFDNNSGNNYLYWIGNANSTSSTSVQVVKMDQDGNVLGSYNINANTSNYNIFRMSLGNGYGSGFTISETGLLVFGITANRTSNNSRRALLIKCDFDNLPNLAGLTDTNGSQIISSVTSAGVSRSGLSLPSSFYGPTSVSSGTTTYVSYTAVSNSAMTGTTKLDSLS